MVHFPNLEKVLEAENGQFGAPGLFRQLLLMAVPFLFFADPGEGGPFYELCGAAWRCCRGGGASAGTGHGAEGLLRGFVSIYLMLSFMLRISKQRIGEGQLGAVAAGIGAGASSRYAPIWGWRPAAAGLLIQRYCIPFSFRILLSGASGSVRTV